MKKVCGKCKTEKLTEEFYKNKSTKDGYAGCCKSCHTSYLDAYKQRNIKIPEEKTCYKCKKTKSKDCFSKMKQAKDGLQQSCKECCKKYKESLKNREDKAESKACPSCKVLLSSSEFNSFCYSADGLSVYCKECTKKKKTEYLPVRRKRKKFRYDNDVQYKIKDSLRKRIRVALKGKAKSKATIALLGCSVDFLKTYLENKFESGMTWENYGIDGWHIDHIIPCSAFDLTDPEQQGLCFHYTNLQPLWAEDNIKKSNSLNWRKR